MTQTNDAREANRRIKYAADPALLKARNAKREANRRARYAADPALRKADYIKREASRKNKRKPPNNLTGTFVGCDGEGARDEKGLASYVLFRMGDRELYRDGARLTTPDLLNFIVAHPARKVIFVGFFFEYDISNILYDVPFTRDPAKPDEPSKLERILGIDLAATAAPDLFTQVRADAKAGKRYGVHSNPYRHGGWTALQFEGYPLFGVDWRPRNHLSVCLLAWQTKKKKGVEKRTLCSLPGTVRTIYDTQGFFQTSFLNALRLWGIGAEHWDTIAAMKADRSSFTEATAQIRRYCAIECDLLAEMMETFRVQCIETDMVPATWNGAGKIATALLKRHGAMRLARLLEITPPAVIDLAHAAYYGGRFETTRAGMLPFVTYEHDINSAYPAAMLELPNFEYGQWIECAADELNGLYIARGTFTHPSAQFLCGLPIRSRQGRLSRPRAGGGVYWSVEIASAQRLGATFEATGGWRFEPTSLECPPGELDCPYDYVDALYAKRLALGKSVRGFPIKLGLNSLYGKRAQRIGKPTYANPIEAGLITAITRARLNDAILAAGDPRRVVMIATDAIYTTAGPIEDLPTGPGLGQWDIKCFDTGLFIVRPGLYWPLNLTGEPTDARTLKTRGISPKFFEPLIPAFEAAWAAWLEDGYPLWPPAVPVPIVTFIGLRLALRRGDPSIACQWLDMNIDCKFAWTDKRKSAGLIHALYDDGIERPCAVMLKALPGSLTEWSHHYDRDQILASSSVFEEDRMLFEAMPDPLDLGPPRL